MAALFETHLHSLPLIARGKVRDNYAVGSDRILMVASDRLSAFDVVMDDPIPGKGELLTQMALFWFDKLSDIVPNHLTGDDPTSVVSVDEVDQVRNRSMLVKRLTPLPIEAVVRGYLAGSGWSEYQKDGRVCGLELPAGLSLASELREPIFTPATKAEKGSHDENVSFDQVKDLVGIDLANQVRDTSIRLYVAARDFARARNIIIADTKFEFGLNQNGVLTLMDEVLTPDSSRFWDLNAYRIGVAPKSYDKQDVRDWLERATINSKLWDKRAPAPKLPPDVISATVARYKHAFQSLVG